nr:MAG TPA: Type I modular polyketide synthase, malonyl-coenzyme A, polyketide, TRANSFERASE.05A [Caudoviricetes sp.]
MGFGVKIVSKTEYYIYGQEGTNCHILMVGK